MKTLEYYFADGTHVKFDNYTIDISGIVRNKKTGKIQSTRKIGGYVTCSVYVVGSKRRNIRVCRALVSTFQGPPPTPGHTVDHVDRNMVNDNLENLRWLCKSGQNNNRDYPEIYKAAFVIVKDRTEKTFKEWVEHFKNDKNHMGRDYTVSMIQTYAKRKQHGFSYKKYPDLPDEVWKEIAGSKTKTGRWEISNMNRVKYITKHAENVLSGDRLGLVSGYPGVTFNGRNWLCHILSFMTFFPEEYAMKKSEEVILHEDDDRLDFRPHKLRIGTQTENGDDAHNNGKYEGTRGARVRCVSYINGEIEKEHDSQHAAAQYLKSIGFYKASYHKIGMVLGEKRITAYGRMWKKIM